ncbi:precorrin-6y C5,15-methyltransferase (decarboxylating) subunit CbiE [Roseospira navarrensis]|uniref:Precorrin-6y C5,15-methyltransferase (Decarboxylating) subunit CbiE n=1 Tax=Roseospira navarrensis TaxID=140058 RepID=A0A7X2D4L6_9PROT|nr:precorrin-6y C5,15-methyltransferase (decarboxylating) subunit CbiE [Roseospira navarrensis]MQX38063.1 precorrin-6y C5,15-methyltransferase (decarboxylating) subunit CbiE [Roseospira navarrensis]
MTDPWLTVVGIGEDGLDGLGAAARRAVLSAPFVIGGARHLDLLPPVAGQQRESWPSPFAEGLDRVQALRGAPVCVLASGDPMFHGVGASLARRVPPAEMVVFPAPSCATLAAARMGWALHEATVLPLHARPLATLQAHLRAGARLLLLVPDGATAGAVAALVAGRGFGDSRMVVLEHLGGPRERRLEGRAGTWSHPPGADLAVIALACAGPGEALPRLPGLPDDAFAHDGQLTKRDQRALTLARLAPAPGALLWDVGAGCGSVAVEWMRAETGCRAIAIESRADRRALILRNREALGVPGLVVVEGRAPAVLDGLEAPDAVFVGGGVTTPGLVEACWSALKPGGRLVANAVSLAGEVALVGVRERWGGDLTRVSVAHAEPLGAMEGWRPLRPVTLWSVRKECDA